MLTLRPWMARGWGACVTRVSRAVHSPLRRCSDPERKELADESVLDGWLGIGDPLGHCRLQAKEPRAHTWAQGGIHGDDAPPRGRHCVVSGEPRRGLRPPRRSRYLLYGTGTDGATDARPLAGAHSGTFAGAYGDGAEAFGLAETADLLARVAKLPDLCCQITASPLYFFELSLLRGISPARPQRQPHPHRFRPGAHRCLVQFTPVGPVAQRLVQGTHR